MSASLPAPAVPSAGTLYVLDTHGMIFQMFHGVGPISAPDGRPANAVFGVTRAIMDLYDHGADYLIATFDRGGKTFREELFSDYKGHRDPPPADLLVQEPMIDAVLEAMRIPILSANGFEADDVMATLADAGAARGLDVYLCTSDKDCRQLLSDKVKIKNLRKGEELDAAGLMAAWGVRPEQVVDFQTLVGDSVDNVPGVPGCGPKTAAKWLAQYGTLDNLVAHADEVGGPKLREALKRVAADGSLEVSRRLVRLDRHVPLAFDWDGWRRRDWDGQRLLELFQEYGFRGFANRVRNTLVGSGAKRNADLLADIGVSKPAATAVAQDIPAPPKPRPGAPSLFDVIDGDGEFAPAAGRDADFAFGALAAPDTWGPTDYQLVDTPAKFDKFLKKLRKQKAFTFDLETTSLDPLRAEPVGYAFAWSEKEAYYLAVRGPTGAKTLDPDATRAALKPVFEDAKVAKRNQNIKYDQLVLRAKGVTLAGVAGDPMVADYLLHSGERSHNLDELTRKYLGHENISITELIGKGKKQLSMDQVDVVKVKDYAAEDADAALRLAALLEPQLAEQGLKKLYDEVEVPLIEVLAELEFNGVRLDVPFLHKLSGEMEAQLAKMEADIHAAADRPFNLASPKQLREVLFDEQKLPVQKRTGTTGEPSTDFETLEKLAAMGHQLPKLMIEHRSVAKLKGTYVDALPVLVNPNTGRVHTSFNQTVAATGRLSSSDPNLQNIPTRTQQGRQIRQAFVPPDGWALVTADYSQVELRLLAHFSRDERLVEAFADDRDVHASVAAEIFKVTEGEVTSAQRRVAKTVNFGVIYGMSAHGLAVRLGMPRKEAETFIDDYFARFPKVLSYQDNLLVEARRTGAVGTLLGRRRRFDPAGIRPQSDYRNRTAAEREAINMEIQGSAADLMKLAMLGVYRRLSADKFRAKMLLTVHDELVFEAPPDEVGRLAAVVRAEMAGAMALSVPLRVDVAAGPNWLAVEDVP
ncbi:MAG: DNA polymerase I [Gemmataceae bacterium]